MSAITSYLLQIKGLLSSDLTVLGVLSVVFLGYTLFFGRRMMISLILAFYPATLLYKTLPFMNKLILANGEWMTAINKAAIFLVFLIPLIIIISRYIISESVYTGSSHIIRTGGFAVAGLILTLLLSYETINLDPIHDFSLSIDALFSGTDRIFWWNLAPLALLAIL